MPKSYMLAAMELTEDTGYTRLFYHTKTHQATDLAIVQ